MSGLDYSTFSIRSALTPTQSTSFPADPIQQHDDVIDAHICNTQREDLPSSSRTRERAFALSGPYQGPPGQTFAFPRPALPSDSMEDLQGSILCTQLGEFHFSPHLDEPANTPTAISENAPWNSPHSLHYPTPVRGSMSSRVTREGPFPEDARPGLTTLRCDVNTTVPTRRASMAITDQQRGLSPCMAMDVSPFLPGGTITSPSPPPTAYHHLLGANAAHPFTYADPPPVMTRQHLPFDRPTGGFQDSAHLDHRFAAAMATPFPPYSPHDQPVCDPSSFIHTQELPRPGSAPPLTDSQMPFVGDVRAALQSSLENAAPSDVTRQHACYPQPCAAQSPRPSPRRAGSIGHNSQKTPPGSRHLRRWSSVTNPALRASPPFSSPLAPNVIPFPRYPAPTPDSAYFSPCSESETDDPPTYPMPHVHAAREHAETGAPSDPLPSPQPPMRTVVRCDGHLIDEESWTAALARSDKLVHVYECFWDLPNTPCGMWIEGDQSSVADHLALFHGFRGGEVTTRCLWRECTKSHMKGTSIARHVVTHIGFRVKCPSCKHEFARVDACNRAHSRSGCLGVGQPMYGDLQRVLDARKVGPPQRPNKKRRTDE